MVPGTSLIKIQSFRPGLAEIEGNKDGLVPVLWIRIQLCPFIRIRIRIRNMDPDPKGQK
jgi:hypothetical protein